MTKAAGSTGEERIFVDGRFRHARGGTYDNVDPATGQVLGAVGAATAEDASDAVGAARTAFDAGSWRDDPAFRARCLRQLHDALVSNRARLEYLVTAETGCPVSITSAVQLQVPVDASLYWSQMAEAFDYVQPLPDVMSFGVPARREVWKEAVGVVLAITPWNYPVFMAVAKLGPALAAGNTVVLKPAPAAPWSVMELARLAAEETDLPPGVLNVLTTADTAVAESLVADPRVDMVTFTGSTAVGKRIMAVASAGVKRVGLELGGKSANILLDDADLEASVPPAVMEVCMHAGQGCAIPTRLLLPRSRYGEGVEIAAATAAQVPYGDPWDADNIQGPVITAAQQAKVLGYVTQGAADGARVVAGGAAPDREGFFVQPTVLADVPPSSVVAQEEIFGPVLAVIPYDDDDHAVAIANDSIYGLSGAVSGADVERALGIAHRLRTGTVGVNGTNWYAPDTPFGGYRQSGIGRENGPAGMDEYLETKAVSFPAG